MIRRRAAAKSYGPGVGSAELQSDTLRVPRGAWLFAPASVYNGANWVTAEGRRAMPGILTLVESTSRADAPRGVGGASPAQRAYLRHGLRQPGGKLPLFDEYGQHYNARTIRSCIARGWAETWFDNSIKPDWLVCKLTPAGRALLASAEER